MPLCFLSAPGHWVAEAAIPSCVGLPPRGTADVHGVAFLSVATPQARSFLEPRTPARQGEPPFPGAESRSLFRRGSGQVGSSRDLAEVPGVWDWMTHTVVSHPSYIRADQAHSNATQAQICPRRLGGEGGSGGDLPRDMSWNLRTKLAPLVMAVFSHVRPRTMSSSLMWLSFEIDRKITSQDKGRAVDNLL